MIQPRTTPRPRPAAATTQRARRGARAARIEGLEGRQLLSTSGLTGTYYDNPDFTGSSVTRVDATVDFNWQTAAPHAAINGDHFSVRWTGKIQPKFSETYTMYVTGDDGARLWVNGQLVIDAWLPDTTFTHAGRINFQGGQLYDVKLEYREDTGRSQVKLAWMSPSQAKQTVPTTALFADATAAAAGRPAPSNPLAPDALTQFNVYDATLFRSKPSRTLTGMKEVVFLYEWALNDGGLWAGTGDHAVVPSVARFSRLLRNIKPGTPVVLDIERWARPDPTEADFRNAVENWEQTLRNFKAVRPDLPVAAYNMLPFSLQAALYNDPADLQRVDTLMRMLQEPGGINDLVAFHAPGAGNVWDRTMPMQDWEKWIRFRADRAKVLNKPVFWILDPYYSGTKEQVSAAAWDREMRVVREIGDSVIIWADPAARFNPADHWYQSILP
jgi:hypothetical protein